MAEQLDPRLEEIIDQAVRDHARDHSRHGNPMSEHPTVDTLVRWQEGLLSADEAAAVRGHVGACSECAEDLEGLEAWDSDEENLDESLLPSAEEVAEERRRFDQRLAAEGRTGMASTEKAPVIPLRRPRPAWPYRFLLAAAALLATLLAGVWLGTRLDRPPDSRPATSKTPFFASLRAQGDAPRRSSGEEIEWPPKFDSLDLRLLLGDVTPHESYRVEVLDAAGEVRYRHDDLPQQPNGTFVVSLPREALSAGSYTVRLLARDGDEEQELATFPFLLRPIQPEP
jgi:hypothetical protein